MQSDNPRSTPMRYTDSRILIGNWNEDNFTKEVSQLALLTLFVIVNNKIS